LRPALIAAGWLWAAAIVWLSLTPSPPQVDLTQGDKLGHFAAYGSLTLWFAVLYPARAIAYGAAFVALGVALEFAQGMTGYRTFDVLDMAANTLGVLAGWGCARLARRLLH
jgi:VanZ family protein